MDFLKIENAAFHSWPAFEQYEKDGWVFRFTDGFTKRANSVNILSVGEGSVEESINSAENDAGKRNLPCIFRMLSFNDNTKIEIILDKRGYHKGDHSLVLIQDLDEKRFKRTNLIHFELEDWITHYSRLNTTEPHENSIQKKMIKRIKGDKILVVYEDKANTVSCGLGVIHNGYFGIFDIVTDPVYRNRGFAYQLISGMLSWAVDNGAHTAYVQVVSDNAPAVWLYKKLGYEPGYEYHYKIQKNFECKKAKK